MRRNHGIALRLAALLVLLTAAGTVHTHSSAGSAPDGFVPGELIIKLAPGVDIGTIAAAYGLTQKEHCARPSRPPAEQLAKCADAPIYLMGVPAGTDPHVIADAMALDLRLVYAEPNLYTLAPLARSRLSWAVGDPVTDLATQVSLPDNPAGGTGTVVAVLDTGIDASHPYFAGIVGPGYDFVGMDADPAEEGAKGIGAFGHGTHVAGLVHRTAPAAAIMPLRVLDQDGKGDVWRVAAGLAYAAEHGADVINLSLSTTERSALLDEFIVAAACPEAVHQSIGDLPCLDPDGRGAVVVAAAGNRQCPLIQTSEGSGSPREYPAASRRNGAISVGASNAAGKLACFSNAGSWVDILAPGEGLLSSVPGGDFETWSGTSMATALVSGEVALIRQKHPSLGTPKVVKHIIETGTEVQGPVDVRIDFRKALNMTPND